MAIRWRACPVISRYVTPRRVALVCCGETLGRDVHVRYDAAVAVGVWYLRLPQQQTGPETPETPVIPPRDDLAVMCNMSTRGHHLPWAGLGRRGYHITCVTLSLKITLQTPCCWLHDRLMVVNAMVDRYHIVASRFNVDYERIMIKNVVECIQPSAALMLCVYIL